LKLNHYPATEWARGQVILGYILADLPTDNRAQNLHEAITCYEAALRIYTEAEFPFEWVSIQNNLGAAYSDLPTGDRGQNLQQAIACHEAALRVRTETDFLFEWARTQNNLGLALEALFDIRQEVALLERA
jgi:tetratricopeptide (TPR) repeat protein